ncbi:MAG TPA: carboxypeptidase-like regulatory domain-containing protein [Bryobacteraceae bacterium]|nr:carboxypeptidase-like regulatory domain-containing protein [Bryobacteraceae bacterium]
MYPRGIAALAIALSMSAAAAYAVTVTGSVFDETGNPVAGARITAQANGVSASASSNASGVYRIEIPAAGNYSLRVEHEGYFLLTNQDTHLDPAAPLDIHLTHLRELAESIDVSYSPPMVDPEATGDVKRLDGQTILNLPYAASQDYRRALPLMPGAIQDNSGIVHFNGGTQNETSYRMDGFDVSNVASGGLTARVDVDTVQSVEWSADRMPAETKGSAGAIDIQTEMGDDRWRFGATNPIPSIGTDSGLYVNHWSPRFMASGPIKKGKAWFHTALDPFYVASTVLGLPAGQNRTSSFTGSDLTRVQWNLSNWQTLTAGVLYNRGQTFRNGLSVLNPAETTVNGRNALMVGTLKDQFIVNGNLIEAGFAQTDEYIRMSPLGSDAYLLTPFGSSGNYFRDQTTHSTRQEFVLNTAFREAHVIAGTHQFRVGADVENSNLDQTVARHPLSVVRADNSPVREIQFLGSGRELAGNLEVYSYATDHWTPGNRVTIDVGFRTQWNRLTGSTPPAPRVAVSWLPWKKAATKFSAGWGVYYDDIPLATLALAGDQSSLTTFFSPPGVFAPQPAPMQSLYLIQPHDLRAPRFTLASAAAESALPHGFVARLDLTSRQGSRGLAFDQYLVSPVLNEYIANNSEHATYRAAEVTLRRTFRAKYQWAASYTRSSARSNAVIPYTVENPLLTPQAGGPEPWDAPNRLLLWGWAPIEKKWFPHPLQRVVGDTDLQLLTEYHTGFAFSSTTENGYLVGGPDSRRFPDFFSVNLALERRFPFRGYLWAFRVGAVNILARSNPNVVNSDYNSPDYLTFERGQGRALNFRLRFLGRK